MQTLDHITLVISDFARSKKFYERALLLELEQRGVRVESQVAVPVTYLGVELGKHVLDVIVDDRIVVELKAVRALEEVHFAMLRSYLRAAGCDVGLLLNFATPRLDIKRVFSRGLDGRARLPGPPAAPGFPRL